MNNKRRFIRQSVKIDAVLHIGASSRFDCQISDYSQGGILVMLKNPRQAGAVSALAERIGKQVAISFPLPGRESRLDASIVRITEHGLGLQLARQDPAYLAALRQAATLEKMPGLAAQGSQAPGNSLLTPARRANLVATASAHMADFLEDQFLDYFASLDRALVAEADRQKSQNAQHPFFDAMASLRRHHRSIIKNFIEKTSSDATAVAEGRWVDDTQKASGGQTKLSLVEKDDFDDWLIVRVAASKAEMTLRDELIELQVRLDAAFGNRGGSRCHNPWAPTAVCNTLAEGIRLMRLDSKILAVVFRTLHDRVLVNLGQAYAMLNRLFIDADVLPDIDVTRYLAAQALEARSIAKPKNEPARLDTPSADAPPDAVATAPQAAEPRAPRTAPAAVSAPAPVGESTQVPGGPGVAGGPGPGGPGSVQSGQQAYDTATRLWSMHRQLQTGDEAALRSSETSSAAEASPSTLAAIDALQARLVEGAPADLTQPGSLKRHLEQGASPATLSGHEQDSADMIESLFDSITLPGRLTEELGPELRKLEVPLLRVMLEDSTLFSEPDHPARQAVNQIAMLADRNSLHAAANRTPVKRAVATILEDHQDGFTQALQQLEKFVARERNMAERNLQRLVEACDGQQQLRLTRQRVELALSERLGISPVPVPLLDLVQHGWKDLMLACLLREGEASRSWDMTLSAVEQLATRLVPALQLVAAGALMPDQSLIKLVAKGLSKVHDADGRHQGLVGTLEGLLQHGLGGVAHDLYRSPPDPDVQSGEPADRAAQRWIKRIEALQDGQWLQCEVPSLPVRTCFIAWIAADRSRFVFASAQGLKIAEMHRHEFAAALAKGHMLLLEDGGLPAVEQGLAGLVQTVYDRMSWESSHDQLTGLRNRKDFTHCLERAVAEARQHQRGYTLILLDLLQFKLINNTCGYEAGDRLLRETAQLLGESAGPEAIMARMGAAEFAVLVPVAQDPQGFMLASRLKTSIESRRFEDAGQSFVIDALLAITGFDQHNEETTQLLRSVEAAAEMCRKSGHQDIQVVRPGDARLEARDQMMSWVTRINRALDQNNLKIRCQKIAPIEARQDELPHYEVLLTVVDADGEHVPPNNFIKAAEEYNRMGAVDRWVIEQVLRWMQANAAGIAQFGGFSINLSGHSMNDESFLNFIFEALVRYQVPRDKLIFEITETVAVQNLEDAADFIREMRGIGCRFSLDDFGVGQSSFSYLKRLPVDYIKIDGSFITNIVSDPVDYALVKSITEMGHFLQKKVIAEYVSDQPIFDTVRAIGVDYVQGFHLGEQTLITELSQLYA